MKIHPSITALDNIKSRLECLKNEDEESAKDIKDDLFLLVKMLGDFDEYLQSIRDVEFVHKNMIINSGNIHKINKFINGKNSLIRTICHIKKEIVLGKLKSKMLPKPEKLSIPWVVKNSDFKFLFSVLMILVLAFSFGLVIEAQYKVGKKLAPWLLAPSSQLQLTLQAEKTTPQKPHIDQKK